MTRRLLRDDGSPLGISYVAPYGHRGAAIRVLTGGRKEALLGAGGDFALAYALAVDRRLEALGLRGDAEARIRLTDALPKFMERYRLKLEPVTHLKLIQEEK